LAPLIILEQTLKYRSCRVLKMVPNCYVFCFFNIFRKYTIMEKRIQEFVEIAIAVKGNRGENRTRCVLSRNEFFSLLVSEGVIIDSRTDPRSRISLHHPAARQFCRCAYTITDNTIKSRLHILTFLCFMFCVNVKEFPHDMT
jgi:hypothetical protein